MIKYRDECVGCPPERGCLGSSCPNRNIPVVICDICGEELWHTDDEWEKDGDYHVCNKCKEKEEI